MIKIKLAIFTALLFLLLVSRANAEYVVPGQRLSTDPLVAQAVAVGQQFWATHPNVRPCPIPTVEIADDLSTNGQRLVVAERADQPGCGIWIAAWIVGAADTHSDLGLRNLCRVTLHALGHTAGLGHSTNPNSIMAAEFDFNAPPRRTPSLCRQWAASVRSA